MCYTRNDLQWCPAIRVAYGDMSFIFNIREMYTVGQVDTRLGDIFFILITMKLNNFKQIDTMVSNKQVKNVSVIIMNLFPINCRVDVFFSLALS